MYNINMGNSEISGGTFDPLKKAIASPFGILTDIVSGKGFLNSIKKSGSEIAAAVPKTVYNICADTAGAVRRVLLAGAKGAANTPVIPVVG